MRNNTLQTTLLLIPVIYMGIFCLLEACTLPAGTTWIILSGCPGLVPDDNAAVEMRCTATHFWASSAGAVGDATGRVPAGRWHSL